MDVIDLHDSFVSASTRTDLFCTTMGGLWGSECTYYNLVPERIAIGKTTEMIHHRQRLNMV